MTTDLTLIVLRGWEMILLVFGMGIISFLLGFFLSKAIRRKPSNAIKESVKGDVH